MGYLWRPIRLQGNVFDYTKQSKQAKFDFIKNQSKSLHFKQLALFNSNCFFFFSFQQRKSNFILLR